MGITQQTKAFSISSIVVQIFLPNYILVKLPTLKMTAASSLSKMVIACCKGHGLTPPSPLRKQYNITHTKWFYMLDNAKKLIISERLLKLLHDAGTFDDFSGSKLTPPWNLPSTSVMTGWISWQSSVSTVGCQLISEFNRWQFKSCIEASTVGSLVKITVAELGIQYKCLVIIKKCLPIVAVLHKIIQ